MSDVGTYFGETPIDHVVRSINNTGVALMGVLTNSSRMRDNDQPTINQNLRKELDLFANVVHCRLVVSVIVLGCLYPGSVSYSDRLALVNYPRLSSLFSILELPGKKSCISKCCNIYHMVKYWHDA